MNAPLGRKLHENAVEQLTTALSSSSPAAVSISGKLGALKVSFGHLTVDYHLAKAALHNNPIALKALKEHKATYMNTTLSHTSSAGKIMYGLRKMIFSLRSNTPDEAKRYMMDKLHPKDVLKSMLQSHDPQEWLKTPDLALSYIKKALKSGDPEVKALAEAADGQFEPTTVNLPKLINNPRTPPLKRQEAMKSLAEHALADVENNSRQDLSNLLLNGNINALGELCKAIAEAVQQNGRINQLRNMRDTLEKTLNAANRSPDKPPEEIGRLNQLLSPILRELDTKILSISPPPAKTTGRALPATLPHLRAHLIYHSYTLTANFLFKLNNRLLFKI